MLLGDFQAQPTAQSTLYEDCPIPNWLLHPK